MASYTSWHIGGNADKYYRPSSIEDLAEFLSTLSSEEPITCLGLGSNVLIDDAGIRGVVIHTLLPKGEEGLSLVEPTVLRVEAGIPCAKVAKFCVKNGLVGGEFFAGIPGTIGGALFMNAGAFGSETWKHVKSVEVINRYGEQSVRLPKDYKIGYRSAVGPKEEWFIAGHFQFEAGDPEITSSKIKELLRQRNASQPIGVFSCGSVFKNPPNDYAGRLIEASKLKGFSIGGAQVSLKHANFIVNLGNARSLDVSQLIEHIQGVVWADHQVKLYPEVKKLS